LQHILCFEGTLITLKIEKDREIEKLKEKLLAIELENAHLKTNAMKAAGEIGLTEVNE
jgi:hypothetical protein